MSSAFDIQGRNCLFQMLIGDDYLDVVCAKTFSFNRVYELKETTTVASGYDKEFRPRKKSYTISFNGVVQVLADSSKPTIKTLFDYAEQFLPVGYRLIYEDNTGNVMVIVGQCYVNSSIFNSNPINLLDGTVEMTGNGPIEILDEVPEFITLTVQVTGEADAKTRFILYEADGTIAYDTSTLLALLPTSGWLVQGETVIMQVQKGQYAWGISTDDILSSTNTFDLDITPAVAIGIPGGDYNQNSLPTVYDFLTNKTALFTIGPTTPPPSCVAPAIVGSPSLPNGQVGVPYNYSFSITGSPVFSLSNVTKPAWMTIAVVESPAASGLYIIQFSGTPDTTSISDVELDINNACGSVNFTDTLTVTSPGTLILFTWSNTVEAGAFGYLKIYKNGVNIVNQYGNGSGNFSIVSGDVIEAQSIGSIILEKTLTITGTVSGVIFTDTDTANVIHSFTPTAGQIYDIDGTINPL